MAAGAAPASSHTYDATPGSSASTLIRNERDRRQATADFISAERKESGNLYR